MLARFFSLPPPGPDPFSPPISDLLGSSSPVPRSLPVIPRRTSAGRPQENHPWILREHLDLSWDEEERIDLLRGF